MFHSNSNVDPFKEEPLQKAFYFPSLERNLTIKQQKTCLSPDKMAGRPQQLPSKKDSVFLRGSNKLSSHEIPTREDGTVEHDTSSGSQFNESWPSTDKNVSSLLSQHSLSSSTTPAETEMKKDHTGSTLSKYIKRFRHGAPASREHREHVHLSNDKDFWWLSPPSSSSTPKETTTSTSKISPLSTSDTSPKKANKLPKKKLGSKPLRGQLTRPLKEVAEEEELDNLRTRTDILLEKSENTCSDISTPESIPKRPSSWMLEKHKRQEVTSEAKTGVPRSRLAPEDDILYQWRLARRLEKAQEEAKSSSTTKYLSESSHYGSANSCRSVVTRNMQDNEEQWKEHNRGTGMAKRNEEHYTKKKKEVCREESRVKERTEQSKENNRGTRIAKINEEQDRRKNEEVDHEESRIKEKRLQRKEQSVQCDRGVVVNKEHTAESVKDMAIETDVPGICFIQDLPRHVHMMCDILPCSSAQQEHDEPRKVCTNKYMTGISTASTAYNTSIIEQENIIDNNNAKHDKNNQEQVVSDTMSSVVRTSGPLTGTNIKTKVHLPEPEKEDMKLNSVDGNMIGNVIGQVVSERLFSSMSSSRRGSSASELSNEGSEGEKIAKIHLKEKTGLVEDSSSRHNKPSSVSDCQINTQIKKLSFRSKFKDSPKEVDDEILVKLREQADFYQEHLRNIDRLLEQMKE